MRRNWREITDEAEWRDMLHFTGLTPEQLRTVYGVYFRKAEDQPRQHRVRVRATRGPHAALGLYRDASVEEIKSAYRALAMRHHPDHGGSADRMREINEAYRVVVGRV
jgi:DnaJ-domain-containing protein 1